MKYWKKIKLFFRGRSYDREVVKWDNEKSIIMEVILGKQYENVLLSLLPYELGGELSMFYYPWANRENVAFAIATKELSILCDEGPSNDQFDSFELVILNNYTFDLDKMMDVNTNEEKLHLDAKNILNAIALYVEKEKINPYDTLEFGEKFENLADRFFIFDALSYKDSPEKFGLMVIIEIAKPLYDQYKGNGEGLIAFLKEEGLYPFGLNRIDDLNKKDGCGKLGCLFAPEHLQ